MKSGMIIVGMLVRFSIMSMTKDGIGFHTPLTLMIIGAGIGGTTAPKLVPRRAPVNIDCVFADGKNKKNLRLF